MLIVDLIGNQRQVVSGGFALAVGEQRVVQGAVGERPLGHADHDQPVQLQAQGIADSPDEHAPAHLADSLGGCAQLGDEVGQKRRRPGAVLDGVESGQPVEDLSDGFCRLLLCFGPIVLRVGTHQIGVDKGLDPLAPALPGGRRGIGGKAAHQLGHVLGQRVGEADLSTQPLDPLFDVVGILLFCVGVVSKLLGVVGEPGSPLLGASSHSRLARNPLPGHHRGWFIAAGQDGCCGRKKGENLVAAEVAVLQVEQGQQPSPRQRVGQSVPARAVAFDAGGFELLQRLTNCRCAASAEDGDSGQRNAVSRCSDHFAHGNPDLLIGAGRADDLLAVGLADCWGAVYCAPHPADRFPHEGVGLVIAGEPGYHNDSRGFGQHRDHAPLGLGDPLGQMHDHRFQFAEAVAE